MQEKENDDLQVYELGYHLLGSISENDLGGEMTKIHDLLARHGGEIISEGAPEMRNLAYEISKRVETKYTTFSKAYFGWIKFEINRPTIISFEKDIKMNSNILRYIIMKTVKENTIYIPKISQPRREVDLGEQSLVSGMPEKVVHAPASEEEIDKSIDELVIS
ncbi:MAG: 30S ribosomal protein S6 [Patescibacteria group bacterium]